MSAVKKMTVRDMARIALCAALLAVCSGLRIELPGLVPITLQTFAVFAALGLLGGQNGTICILVYLLLGAVGLPVFSGFTGGLGVLFGNTGGYLVGFLATGAVVWLFEALFPGKRWALPLSLGVGLIALYAFGTAWYLILYTVKTGPIGLGAVLGWCVWPFIVPDLVKMALALLLTRLLGKRLHR